MKFGRDDVQKRAVQQVLHAAGPQQNKCGGVGVNELPPAVDQHGLRRGLDQAAIALLAGAQSRFDLAAPADITFQGGIGPRKLGGLLSRLPPGDVAHLPCFLSNGVPQGEHDGDRADRPAQEQGGRDMRVSPTVEAVPGARRDPESRGQSCQPLQHHQEREKAIGSPMQTVLVVPQKVRGTRLDLFRPEVRFL